MKVYTKSIAYKFSFHNVVRDDFSRTVNKFIHTDVRFVFCCPLCAFRNYMYLYLLACFFFSKILCSKTTEIGSLLTNYF